jgi:hypothetical protein
MAWVQFPTVQDLSLFHSIMTGVVPIQPPIQWVPGAFSLRVKQLGHEADHSSPSSAKVKKGGAITSTPQMSSGNSAQLIKYRDFAFVVKTTFIFSVRQKLLPLNHHLWQVMSYNEYIQ